MFNEELNTATLTNQMGINFEMNNYVRGEKDILIRFVVLLINAVIKSGQVTVDSALKVQKDILEKIEFKRDPPHFSTWLKTLAINCFNRLDKIKARTSLSVSEKAALYIQSHINQKLSLSLLAKVLECSESSLAHLFKEKYNITVGKYINLCKIDSAKYMLKNSQMNISGISYALAFNDANYFMRVFKKNTGMTPTHYRKMHAQ